MELLRTGCFSSQNAASQLLLIGYLALTFTLTLTQVFTPQDAKAILKSHNEYRRQESASDMYLLHWNVSLQQRADSWAHRCLFKHERNLDLGENLYFDTDHENGVFERGIEGWHKEKSNWGYTDQSCTGACHFTQLVWAYTTTIGCSAHVCPALNVAGRIIEDAMFLVCYYYPRGNFAGHFPYSRGRPCSECAPGDTCSNNLCVSSGPESKLAPGCGGRRGQSLAWSNNFVKTLVPQTPVRLSRMSTSLEAFKSLIQNFGSVNLAQPYQQRTHHVESHHRQQHHYQSETVIQSSSASASASSSSSSSSSRTHLTHISQGGKEHHRQLHHISQQHNQHSSVLQQHNRERQWVTELEQERRQQQKEREEEEERRRQQELEERQRQQAREEQERWERMMEEQRREEEERRQKMFEEQQRLQEEEQRRQQELAEKRQREEQERLQMLEEMRKRQQEELEQRRQLLEEQRREQERLEEQSRTQQQHRQHHHHHQQGLTYNQDRDLVLSRNQESSDRTEGNFQISLQRPTDRSEHTTTERFDTSPVQTHHHINREHETDRIGSSNRESRLTSSRQTIRTQGISRGEDPRGRYGVAHQRSTQSHDDSTSTSTVGTVVNILSRGEIDRRNGGYGYETVSRPYEYGQVHRSGSSIEGQVKTYKHHSYSVSGSQDSKSHTSIKAEENETENESKEDRKNNRKKKWLKRWQNRMKRKRIDADSHRHKHSYVMESDGRRCVDRHPSCDQWVAKCHRSAAVTIACPLTCGKCGKNLLLSQAQGDQPARSSYHSYHMRSNLQSYHRVDETQGESKESKKERQRKRRLSAEERRRRRLERRRLRTQGAPLAIRAPPDSSKRLERLSRRRSKEQRQQNLAIQREERRQARRRHRQARPDLCRDDPKHIKSCKYWAKKGFCADNRLIKTIFCQLSCGHCSG